MKRQLEKVVSEELNPIKLIKAITTGNIKEARQLIIEMSNEEINVADENGSTALHRAVFGGHKKMCELLISKMSQEATNVADEKGLTALNYAAFGGHKEVCGLLISKMGLEAANAVNRHGKTALHDAAFGGHKEVCRLLISKMSQEAIDAVNRHGKTALHDAAFGGHKEVCGLLISKMSQEAIDAVNRHGKTALHDAASKDYKEICKVLISDMHTGEVVKLLNQSNSNFSIQKVIGEIVAAFINDMFSISEINPEINPIDFTGYQIKLLTLYQIVDQNLLISYLNEKIYISSTDNYITKHYFTLIGVCKSVRADNPISILVNSDCMPHMLSYLVPHSLCPELFIPIELAGENSAD